MTKNDLLILIGLITFALILWNLRISMQIADELTKRGIRVRIAHQRGRIFKYLKMYREITAGEAGRPGPLYFRFILSFVLFMTSLFAGIVLSAS